MSTAASPNRPKVEFQFRALSALRLVLQSHCAIETSHPGRISSRVLCVFAFTGAPRDLHLMLLCQTLFHRCGRLICSQRRYTAGANKRSGLWRKNQQFSARSWMSVRVHEHRGLIGQTEKAVFFFDGVAQTAFIIYSGVGIFLRECCNHRKDHWMEGWLFFFSLQVFGYWQI